MQMYLSTEDRKKLAYNITLMCAYYGKLKETGEDKYGYAWLKKVHEVEETLGVRMEACQENPTSSN